MISLSPFKKNEQVVRPLPVEISFAGPPADGIISIWSHLYGGWLVCMIKRAPLNDQYASAVSEPNVSWWRFFRWLSPVTARSRSSTAGPVGVGGVGVAVVVFGFAASGGQQLATSASSQVGRDMPAAY